MRKIVKISLISLLSFVLVIYVYLQFGFPWNYLAMKERYEDHLNSYEEQMELNKVHFDFLHKKYIGYAHLKRNPDVSFIIQTDRTTGAINDSYEYTITQNKAREEVAAILDHLLPNRLDENIELVSLQYPEVEINIWVIEAVDEQTKLSIKQAIEKEGYIADQLFFSETEPMK